MNKNVPLLIFLFRQSNVDVVTDIPTCLYIKPNVISQLKNWFDYEISISNSNTVKCNMSIGQCEIN